jgi:prephenate dehydrogenase
VLAYGVGVRWGKVTIIGMGLLGGSLGLALMKHKLAREVYGFARRKATIGQCLKNGVTHRAGIHLDEAVAEADLVVLCTPTSQMASVTGAFLPVLKQGAIVTDVGSVKVPVVRKLGPLVRKAGGHFVGSHPMAGSERSGVSAARADLFEEAVCVVSPTGTSNPAAAKKIVRFWRSLGAEVLTLTPALHDKFVSRASHLPHLVACALAKQVLDPRRDRRQRDLCAAGFRDTTRVACGSPDLWRDISLANRDNLIRDLADFEKNLRRLRKLLAEGDTAGLERFLRSAAERRIVWEGRSDAGCSA